MFSHYAVWARSSIVDGDHEVINESSSTPCEWKIVAAKLALPQVFIRLVFDFLEFLFLVCLHLLRRTKSFCNFSETRCSSPHVTVLQRTRVNTRTCCTQFERPCWESSFESLVRKASLKQLKQLKFWLEWEMSSDLFTGIFFFTPRSPLDFFWENLGTTLLRGLRHKNQLNPPLCDLLFRRFWSVVDIFGKFTVLKSFAASVSLVFTVFGRRKGEGLYFCWIYRYR